MSLQVKYFDVPEGWEGAATPSSTTPQPFYGADVRQLIDGADDIAYATLEPSSWVLDGTRQILPDTPELIGWWSEERSGDDGLFVNPPVITISLSSRFAATGITFRFWPAMGQWCNNVRVTWYGGEDVLAQAEVHPDNAKWVLDKIVEGFNKVQIELLGTNIPGQFAKVQQIQIGQVVVFLYDELVRVSLLNEIDPSLCELSADTMTVEIFDKKNRTLIPQKNQKMELSQNGKQLAVHYITDSSRENRQYYKFQCESAIGRIEDTFYGGVYDAYPVGDLLRDVLRGFAAEYGDFAQETVTGYLPVCTRREALQQIAFAIGAIVITQGNGEIKLVPLEEHITGSFDGSNIFPGAKVTREANVAAIHLTEHRYTPIEETETLLDQEIVRGRGVKFVFSEPHHSYEIIGDPLAATIITAKEHWVSIIADGPVTLVAKKYQHSALVNSWENAKATVAEMGNVVKVENATLVNSENANAVLERLKAFHKMKNALTQEVIVDGQKAGQKVESINPWGTLTVGYITSMESEFTNTGHTANVKILGVEKTAAEAEVLTV